MDDKSEVEALYHPLVVVAGCLVINNIKEDMSQTSNLHYTFHLIHHFFPPYNIDVQYVEVLFCLYTLVLVVDLMPQINERSGLAG